MERVKQKLAKTNKSNLIPPVRIVMYENVERVNQELANYNLKTNSSIEVTYLLLEL